MRFQGDFYSLGAPLERSQIRSRSQGDELGSTTDDDIISLAEAADPRSTSEPNLAERLSPMKRAMDPNDLCFIEREVPNLVLWHPHSDDRLLDNLHV